LIPYWAAISGGMLLLVLAFLLYFLPSYLILDALIVVGVFLGIESILTHKFVSFLLSVTIVLAIVTSLILIWNFIWEIFIFGIIAIVLLAMVKNLRKL